MLASMCVVQLSGSLVTGGDALTGLGRIAEMYSKICIRRRQCRPTIMLRGGGLVESSLAHKHMLRTFFLSFWRQNLASSLEIHEKWGNLLSLGSAINSFVALDAGRMPPWIARTVCIAKWEDFLRSCSLPSWIWLHDNFFPWNQGVLTILCALQQLGSGIMGCKKLDVMTRQESLVSDEVCGAARSLEFLKPASRLHIRNWSEPRKIKILASCCLEMLAMIFGSTEHWRVEADGGMDGQEHTAIRLLWGKDCLGRRSVWSWLKQHRGRPARISQDYDGAHDWQWHVWSGVRGQVSGPCVCM